MHGGALYTLADSAFEVACNSYGRICVALDVTVHHASAAPLGEPVTAEAVDVSRSARVASYRITATGTDGAVAPGTWPPRTVRPAGSSAPTAGRRPGTTPTDRARVAHRHTGSLGVIEVTPLLSRLGR